MIRLTTIIKGLFVLSFLIYVVSVSWYSWKNMNTYFYTLKHFSALLPSVLFVFFILKRPTIKKRLVILPFLFALIIIPFAIRGNSDFAEIVIFIQLLLFLLSAYVFSKIFIKDNISFSKYEVAGLFTILLIPGFLDIVFNAGDFIYNTWYGRSRLLVGFYHPKEAGVSMLVALIFFKLYFRHRVSLIQNVVFQVTFFMLLYFMQSRNSLLLYLNFLVINFLLTRVNIATIIFFYFVLPALTFASVAFIYFEELNRLTSNRLENWLKDLDFSLLGKGSSIADFDKSNLLSKLHVDNFYLEYFIENGFIFFIVLFVMLASVIYLINKFKFNGVYINAVFIPYLIFCFFDAGMFSSGNFLNLFIWSLVFAALQYRPNYFRLIHQKTSQT